MQNALSSSSRFSFQSSLAVLGRGLPLLLLVGACVAARCEAEDSKFAALLKQADAAAKDGEGKNYDETVGVFELQAFVPALNDCAKAQGGRPAVDFDMAGYITASGRVDALFIEPETALADCLAPTVRAATFPLPPHKHYPVHLAWHFAKNKAAPAN